MLETAVAPTEPCITTPLPGPKCAALIEQDKAYISPSYTRGYPLSIERGEGAMVQDVDGNWFLDFCAGIAVCSTGHGHPEIVKTIQDQAAKFIHMSGTDFYYHSMADLAQKLSELSPGNTPKKTFFTNSGAESNEGAMKLARYYTKRPNIISFYRCFHGRTFGAMSLGASKAVQRSGFSPMLPGIFHAHSPYPYRPFFGNTSPEAEAQACLDYIETHIFKTLALPNEVAAIFVEPIQGEGGYIVPPKNWLPGLRELCDKHGILLVVDEVQSGIGRTGKIWACEYDGIEPDIITSAKGLASGLPLGAIIAKSHIMTWPPGAHATTFGGNPVACATALKTLELVDSQYRHNANEIGQYMLTKLSEMAKNHPSIGDVRGRGLMIGIELVKDKTSREKAPELRNQVVDACFEKGLLILGCGENTVRLSPPLIITQQQADVALRIFDEVLTAHGA